MADFTLKHGAKCAIKRNGSGGASTPFPTLDIRTCEGGPVMPVEANIAILSSLSIRTNVNGGAS